ncbi:Brain tumor protein [Eumeta japonica]|uniref:Brain tumor protein n=1 Tax=Eumeta variegata TaxID=151549 RepID=A0A4C1ULF6_EUMVA|nr:Brain tumor protein [Eumeta japonica]
MKHSIGHPASPRCAIPYHLLGNNLLGNVTGFQEYWSLIDFISKEFYVCDFKGHYVVVFDDEGRFLRRIGCENVTNFPNGIDVAVSDAGDVLIGDSHGNKFHVAVC